MSNAGLFDYYGVWIHKILTIRGAQWGVDARGRSVVGIGQKQGVPSDPKESTVTILGDTLWYGIVVSSPFVELDGITITSPVSRHQF